MVEAAPTAMGLFKIGLTRMRWPPWYRYQAARWHPRVTDAGGHRDSTEREVTILTLSSSHAKLVKTISRRVTEFVSELF
jgi:hypothetical protein